MVREAESARARLQTGWIREGSTKSWHFLEFEGAINMTICGLVIHDGDRRGRPSPGALICSLCLTSPAIADASRSTR